MRLTTLLILPAVLLASLCGGARAGTITVSPDPGNDPIAAALAELGDGDRLVLTEGTYDERITLVGLSKVKVIGKGEVIFDGVGPAATISVSGCEKVVIQGLTIVNAPTQGISVANSDKVKISKCNVIDFDTMGVVFGDSTNCSLQKCQITGGTFGVYLTGSTTAKVTGNTIEGATSHGVFFVIVDLPGSRVSKNTIADVTAGTGIELDGVGNRADRNTVSDCQFGITTPFVGGDMADSSILGNTVVGTLVALRTYSSGGLTIAKNKLSGTTASAVQLASAATDVVVTRNSIDGSQTSSGIDDEGSGSVVTKNKLTNTINYGIRARGTSGTFEKNSVHDTAADGFLVTTGGHSFTRNKASGNAGLDLNSGSVTEASNTYSKNTFGTVAFAD